MIKFIKFILLLTVCVILVSAFAIIAENQQNKFDVRIINQWGGQPVGSIRMVGGWPAEDGVIEDEQGQLWRSDYAIATDDFLLLWIDDNNTPNSYTDDLIVKVWREAH